MNQDPRELEVRILFSKLVSTLRYKGGFRRVYWLNASVPVVRMKTAQGLDIDICVNRRLGVFNSRLLATYSKIDSRARDLGIAVKLWAKGLGIADTFHGTISAYAYIILVIHFLQIKRILPCLQIMVPESEKLFIENCDVSFHANPT